MAKKVSVGVEITGKDKGFKASMDGAAKATQNARQKIDKQNKGMMASFKKLGGAIGATFAIRIITRWVSSFTEAYKTQQEAEVKLQTIMKQRMGLGEAAVQDLKDLASEYQKVGVIGDEVQLAGIQQLATFVRQKDSLERMMPAMNNLIAQQKGYNAQATDAVNIANMMGRALTGQLGALTRVGITFSEAQGEALRFGDETERAAALTDIINDNVGNVNIELGKTDLGKLTQMNNNLGDTKEKLGELIIKTNAWKESIRLLDKGIGELNTTLDALTYIESSKFIEENMNWWEKAAFRLARFTKLGRENISLMAEIARQMDKRAEASVTIDGEEIQAIKTLTTLRAELKDLKLDLESVDVTNKEALLTSAAIVKAKEDEIKVYEDLVDAILNADKIKGEQLKKLKQEHELLTGIAKLKVPRGAGPIDTGQLIPIHPQVTFDDMGTEGLAWIDDLESAFEGFFQMTEGGFESMAASFGRALQQMAAQLAAKAAIFAILTLISGGSGAIAMQAGRALGNFSWFAQGGIASGPAMGMVGEYPGAATNPEVIAPLNSLKNIIGASDQNIRIEGVISGRDLALIMRRNT